MKEDDPIRGTDRRVATHGGLSGVVAGVEEAIRYPAESDDAVRTVAIGGLLVLFGFLVVPLFVVGDTPSGCSTVPRAAMTPRRRSTSGKR